MLTIRHADYRDESPVLPQLSRPQTSTWIPLHQGLDLGELHPLSACFIFQSTSAGTHGSEWGFKNLICAVCADVLATSLEVMTFWTERHVQYTSGSVAGLKTCRITPWFQLTDNTVHKTRVWAVHQYFFTAATIALLMLTSNPRHLQLHLNIVRYYSVQNQPTHDKFQHIALTEWGYLVINRYSLISFSVNTRNG